MAPPLSFILLLYTFLLSVQSLPQKRALNLVGDPVRMGDGFYPRATKINDGSLLGCFTSGNSTNKHLQIVRSTNSGQIWGSWGVVIDAPKANGLDNCAIHQSPNSNRVLAAFRNHVRDPDTNAYIRHVLSVRSSDDDGKTWKVLSTVTEDTLTGARGVWEPFMMNGLDDSLMLFFSRETRADGKDQNSILVRSQDGGKTWGAEQTISGQDRQARDGMLGVARTAPGSSELIAVFESLAPETGITSVTSPDDGKTWGNRQIVYRSSVAGSRQQAPQVVLVGRTLVTSFQTNEDNPDTDTNIPFTKVIASTDQAASWHEKITVHEKCEWAGLVGFDEKNLLVLCNVDNSDVTKEVSYSHHVSIS
jgi:hypothetical protein